MSYPWPSAPVRYIRKLDTTPALQMVSACKTMLERMSTQQYMAFKQHGIPAYEPWLHTVPILDTDAAPEEVARLFGHAMSNLRRSLTSLAVEAGYNRYAPAMVHPCSTWTSILNGHSLHLEQYVEKILEHGIEQYVEKHHELVIE